MAAAAIDAPVIVIVPTDGDVEQMVADVRFFFGALAGLSDHERRHGVLPFPSHEVDPYRGLAPHFDVATARGRALFGLATGSARVVVAAAAALLPRLSAPDRLLAAGTRLVVGALLEPPDLGDLLADAGFTPEDPVDAHGEYCVRGGVVDFFPAGDDQPIRAEFAGDSLESLRRFDPATQRSTRSLDRAEILPLRELFDPGPDHETAGPDGDRSAWLLDYAGRVPGHRLTLSEADESAAAIKKRLEQAVSGFSDAEARGEAALPPEELLVDWPTLDAWLRSAVRLEQLWEDQDSAHRARHVPCQPVVEFHGRLADWAAEITRTRERGETALLVAGTPGRAERVIELLAEYDLTALLMDGADATHGAALLVATGQLTRGFRLPGAGLQIFAEPDVFDEERRVRDRRTGPAKSFLSDFRDLKVGDHVVHVDHGVGMFVGLKQIPVGIEHHEFMELRYAGQDKLFVPVQQLDLLQKYTGTASAKLDRLGGTSWAKTKTKVQRAMRDMAEELLKLYAAASDGVGQEPQRNHAREVERGDRRHHPQRLTDHDLVDPAGDVFVVVALDQRRHAAGDLDVLDAATDLAARLSQSLAALGGQDPGQVFETLLQGLLEGEEVLHPLGDRRAPPLRQGGLRPPHAQVDLRRRRQRHLGQGLGGRRIQYVQIVGGVGLPPAAADVIR